MHIYIVLKTVQPSTTENWFQQLNETCIFKNISFLPIQLQITEIVHTEPSHSYVQHYCNNKHTIVIYV